MVKEYLKKLGSYTPGKPIEEVKRELGLKRVFKMASNENPFSPPRPALKEIRKRLKDLNRYPDGQSFYLKNSLSKKLNIGWDNLVFGNGSDELVVLVLRACLEPGQEIIIGNPTFMIYELQAKAFEVKVVKSPMKDFSYDLDDIKKKITPKTRVIFIANPDNPNGTYLSRSRISEFVKSIPKDILIFLDEAYYEFAPVEDFPDSVELVRQGYNLLVTRTFSKAYGLAGLRIGFGLGQKELIEALNKIREPFNINSLAQAAAVKALSDKRYLNRVVGYINKEKDYIYSELDRLGIKYVRSATNFILFSTGLVNSKFVFESLLKQGIIVRHMSSWGMDNFIRVTVSKHRENKKFIQLLKTVLSKD
jgi:histidinol-phosphate aminotransferase